MNRTLPRDESSFSVYKITTDGRTPFVHEKDSEIIYDSAGQPTEVVVFRAPPGEDFLSAAGSVAAASKYRKDAASKYANNFKDGEYGPHVFFDASEDDGATGYEYEAERGTGSYGKRGRENKGKKAKKEVAKYSTKDVADDDTTSYGEVSASGYGHEGRSSGYGHDDHYRQGENRTLTGRGGSLSKLNEGEGTPSNFVRR